MKVHVYAWFGQPLPLGLVGGEQEVSDEMFLKLFRDGHDVMLKHCRPDVQTKKQKAREGEKPDRVPLLCLDIKYGGFRPR